MNTPQPGFQIPRTLRKLLLSAFVVFSFVAYAIHKPFTSSDGKLGAVLPTPQVQVTQQLIPTPTQPEALPTATSPSDPTQAPQIATPTEPPPTDTPALAQGGYKDGTYTGPEVDALYGLVQVRTVIRNGKISDVQFLEYPSDRRTSVRINNYAVPYLQQEAIQAQSANVDIITGATLTSEAFIMSLQSALANAKG